MENGRWYPTAITLEDGSVLVCSGRYATPSPLSPPPPPPLPNTPTNNTPEIWIDGQPGWTRLSDFRVATGADLTLFPRLHLAPDGRVFMSGTSAASFFFDRDNHHVHIFRGKIDRFSWRDYAMTRANRHDREIRATASPPSALIYPTMSIRRRH